MYKPIAFILILFLFSCSSDPESGASQKSPEKIEFPITRFQLNAKSDTTIFGPKGTRIFIGKESFQFDDGSPVDGSIKIDLKEFYDQADMILGDLSTSSDGKLLETAGMIYIEATSNGKKLELKPGKRVVVHFPKESFDRRKMDLFYADPEQATNSSVSNWDVDTTDLVKRTLKLGSFGWWYPSWDDSTEYNFTPKGYVDTGYYWNPLDFYVSSYDFTEKARKEIESVVNKNTYYKFESWNDFGIECEMNITIDGRIKNPRINTKGVSQSTRRELIQFLRDLPQLEPGKNKYGKIIERKGLIFIQGGNVVPKYKTDEKYVKSFNSKYSKYENEPIQNMDDAEMEYFIFSVSKLGWINCDRFIESEETIDVLAEVPVDKNIKLKMVFSEIDGILKPIVRDNKYVFQKVPKGKNVSIIAIKNEGGHFSAAFKEVKISSKPIKNLSFNETSLAELRSKLEEI